MARPGETGETGQAVADPAAVDPPAVAQPLQPVRAGGSGRPIGLALATAAVLATLVWQPWGRGGSPVVPPIPAAGLTVGAASVSPSPGGSPNAGESPNPGQSPSPSPGSPVAEPRGPRPSFRATGSGSPGSTPAVSVLDDEWAVVAFLAPDDLASADEPFVPDGTGAIRARDGSLVVRQQQLAYATRPLERPGEADAACRAPGGFRLAAAAHLPPGQVAYLGVTFPGMSPRARVGAVALDRSRVALKRLPLLVVPTSDTPGGGRYTVPGSGEGGAALFVAVPQGILPLGAYRFDVRAPGVAGVRYLYACIGP